MKRLKCLVLALSLLTGFTLTSCLNGDTDSTVTASPVVKVCSMYMGLGVYFETIDGKRIEPSESSYNASLAQGMNWDNLYGQIIQLVYNYDSTSPDVVVDDDGVSGVTLVSYAPMNSAVEVVEAEGAANDSVGNMPIISIGEENYNGSSIKVQYWDAQTLLVPINYYINRFQHTFTLEYHAYEPSTDGTLRLYLEHNKQSDTPTIQVTSLNLATVGSTYLFYRAFDLRPVANYLALRGQAMPSTITIVVREDDYNVDLSDMTATKDYVVEPYEGDN